jgi:hypothetical protein
MSTTKTTTSETVRTEKAPKPAAGQAGIYHKILLAQQAIASVPKRGYNSFHKYHYATEADILSIKDILNEKGLIVLPTTLHQETGLKPDGKSWASVTLLFRVIDAASGEHIESQFTGYAEDSFDKAIYKATTGANKYFYLKFFGIATEDDPERDDAPQRGDSLARFTANMKSSRPAPMPRRQEVNAGTPVSPARRNEALANANKILALQKQAGLSNEEVLLYGEIDSIKVLAEAGDADQLAQAYRRLQDQLQHKQQPQTAV